MCARFYVFSVKSYVFVFCFTQQETSDLLWPVLFASVDRGLHTCRWLFLREKSNSGRLLWNLGWKLLINGYMYLSIYSDSCLDNNLNRCCFSWTLSPAIRLFFSLCARYSAIIYILMNDGLIYIYIYLYVLQREREREKERESRGKTTSIKVIVKATVRICFNCLADV